jgi:hypothetical protein
MGDDCCRVHERIQAQSDYRRPAEGNSDPYPGAADSIDSCTVVSAGRALNPAVQVEFPNESAQTEPQLFPILHLHRHKDAYVVISSKSGDDMVDRCSVRIDHLQTYFPQYREQLLKDSFVGINADWRLARGKGLCGYPLHRTDGLRYLCACYVDLDYYKLGLQFGAVFGTIISLQDQGKIPPASIIVRSGRGIWLLWLLHDPKNPYQAQGAFPEKIDLYLRVERAIVDRLSDLGADTAARCAVRRIRIPGSFHTGSEQYVQWWVQGKENGGYSYTLAELAKAFGVGQKLHHAIKRAFIEGEKPKNKRNRGWQRLASYRLREFSMLRSARGEFSKGCRNHAALIYAFLLRCSGVSREDAASEVASMGAECHPPLPLSACRAAIKSAFGRRLKKLRDQTISDWLDITPEESQLLPHRTNGHRLPAASRFASGVAAATQMAADTCKQARHAMILRLVKSGNVPPCRAMAHLLGEIGFPVGFVQVSKDYRALHLESQRTKHLNRNRTVSVKPMEFNFL